MPRSKQQSGFSIPCGCGQLIHSSDEHIGRTIRCRCGRPLRIARPSSGGASAAIDADAVAPAKRRKRNGRKTFTFDDSFWRRPSLPRLRFSLDGWTSDRPKQRWTIRSSTAYAVGMLITWIALFTLSDKWLPASVLAYGPRWIVLLPLFVLLPMAVLHARASIKFLVVGAVVAIVPVMGLRVAVPPSGFSAPNLVSGDHIRVLTFNAQGGEVARWRLAPLLARYTPSIISIQECGDRLAAAAATQRDWFLVRYESLCTMSRWPIAFADTMPRAAFARVSPLGYGGAGLVVRYGIAHPTRPFQFVNLHLETARKGLEGLLGADGLIPDDPSSAFDRVAEPSAGEPGVNRVALNTRVRESESERASVWSARKMDEIPVVVAGDFNMPVESSLYRRYWSGLTNAFDSQGVGFGFSKREGPLLRLRIDHILSSPKFFRVLGAWLGDDAGSDHLPMVADLQLVQPSN